jgi:hypothetical protein
MSEIEAGRETDMIVAEKIMRQRVPVATRSEGLKTRKAMIEKLAAEGNVPHYSTDIAAAWPVLEWLQALMGPETLIAVGFDHAFEAWVCGDTTAAADVRNPLGSGETAPLAICRAALQAYAKYVAGPAVQREDELIRRSAGAHAPEDWGHEDCSVCDAARRNRGPKLEG